jgi:DNA-binding transcriptional LysR family regulator
MELHQIRYFLAVVRERNFSRAAESCNITQPALTRAIQKLEEEVRGPVFERRPGNVDLTELGRALLPRFEDAMAAIGEARSMARSLLSERRQRFRLGIMCTLGANRLFTLVAALVRECPQIELQLVDGKGVDIINRLLADEMDAALVGLPRYVPALDVTPLYTERYEVAMSREHRLANCASIALKDLDGEGYIERTNCEFEVNFEDAYGECPIKTDTRCRSEREDCVQALIAGNFGVAIVPQSLALRPDIITRPLVQPEVTRTVSLVTVRDRADTPTMTIMKRLTTALEI